MLRKDGVLIIVRVRGYVLSNENIKANDKYKYLVKNTGILTISSFSSRILVFLLVPLYTSILSTAEYGAYDLSITTIQLLLPIFTVNIYDAIMRFYMDAKYSKKDISAIGLKYLVISVLLFAVAIFINYQFGFFGILDSIKEYSIYVFVYYIVNLFNQYLTQMAKGNEQVRDIAIAGVINTIVTLTLNLLLLLVFRMGINGFFIAYISGQLSSAIILFFKLHFWQYVSCKINKQYEKEMLGYSIPLILGTIGWWCNNASDRYVVTYLCGIAANGIYSVAYKIPSILTTIQQVFLQAWQISAVKEYDDKDSPSFYGNTFGTINIAMCFICMGLILFTKPIASLLYAKDFYAAWQYVPFLLVSGVFNAASGVIGPILNANKNSKSLGASSLVGAVVNIVLNFGLIYLIGVQGAAVATAISSYIIYLLRKRAVGEKINIDHYWKIIISWVLIICQAVVSIYIGNVIIEALLLIIFVIINSMELKNLILKILHIKQIIK